MNSPAIFTGSAPFLRGMASLLFITITALFGLPLTAADFRIEGYTLTAGGGITRGGDYVVSSTLGQPATAHSVGGEYELFGGLRAPLLTVNNPPLPTLVIERREGGVVLWWDSRGGEYRLESTLDLSIGLWQAAPSGNPIWFPITEATVFYRLIKR
jgi:hypothetical protein